MRKIWINKGRNHIFNFYFFNMNFAFTIYSLHTKLRAENIHMQESMSQNFELGLHYYQMKHKRMSTIILIIFQ